MLLYQHIPGSLLGHALSILVLGPWEKSREQDLLPALKEFAIEGRSKQAENWRS